jgi:hypothetical protein
LLGGILNVIHVSSNDGPGVPLDQRQQIVRALTVGGDLRRDVGQVRSNVARRKTAGRQQLAELI